MPFAKIKNEAKQHFKENPYIQCCGPDPDLDPDFFSIPDPGVNKTKKRRGNNNL
jgi:hypothetical protein